MKQRNTFARCSLAINQLAELGDDARPALPALKEVAKDPDPAIRRLATRAIRQIETANAGNWDGRGIK